VGFLLAAQSLLWAGIGVVFWLTDKRHKEAAEAARVVATAEPATGTATEVAAGRMSRRIAS
jgi:hypothetical protein